MISNKGLKLAILRICESRNWGSWQQLWDNNRKYVGSLKAAASAIWESQFCAAGVLGKFAALMPKMSKIKPLCLRVFGAWRNSQQRTQLSLVPGSNKLCVTNYYSPDLSDWFIFTQWGCWNIWEYLGIMTKGKGFNDERTKVSVSDA